MSQFFGELTGTQQTVKEDKYFQNTHELPDAYIGRNKFLMSTLDYLITKEGRDFLTTTILPFSHTDNTNVAWEIFHFDRSIADIEPEQGVPRYVTMKQDVHSDRLVRRGLAFVIEHGFYTTDIGRRHYMMNIQQIVDAVSETTALQALHALIEADDFYSATDSAPDSLLGHLVEQLRRFAVIQRGNAGMHILDSDLKDNMLRYNVRPDAYVMPPRATSYINMRDPYMTEYSRGGRGVEALEGPDQQLTFRGTRVYEARYFETDYVADPFDPLSQVITYAEYYPVGAAATTYLVRPRIRYIASTAILCRAGTDLGETLTGHHDFRLADDVIHKVHVGHYTFYSVAVVKNPKLLQKAQGVFCRDYVGGEDAQYVTAAVGAGLARFLPNHMLMDRDQAGMAAHVAPPSIRNTDAGRRGAGVHTESLWDDYDSRG